MEIVTFRCNTCGEDKSRLVPQGVTPCYGDMCCDCCKKKGLQDDGCKFACLEFELLKKGKKLNKNEEKGIFLERAMSNALNILGIPHKHNPFRLYYSNYQGLNPDIIIESLSAIIECKNINQRQVDLLSTQWLDENVVNRPNTCNYELKLALFVTNQGILLLNISRTMDGDVMAWAFRFLTVNKRKRQFEDRGSAFGG